MKTLLLLAFIAISFASCTKCADCTRVYDYETYELTETGDKLNYVYTAGSSTETFDICGGSDIKNAERQTVFETKMQLPSGNILIGHTIGNCNCVTK